MPDKGKVERPFRYIREDFFLGASFRNLDDLNAQLRGWLDTGRQSSCARDHATGRQRSLRRRKASAEAIATCSLSHGPKALQ